MAVPDVGEVGGEVDNESPAKEGRAAKCCHDEGFVVRE